MIDKKTAGREIGRMIGLDFFPREKAAMNELVLALTGARTEQIACNVVSEFLADCTQCPKPADIRRLIGEHNERYASTLAKCGTCGGTGVIIVGGYYHMGQQLISTTGTKSCECRGAA